MEKEVIVWSDSQRVALIRSMAEQTVFTDSDREGVCYRVYTVSSCELNVFACTHFILMQVFVCLSVFLYFGCMHCKGSCFDLVYMPRSSVLLCLAAQAP